MRSLGAAGVCRSSIGSLWHGRRHSFILPADTWQQAHVAAVCRGLFKQQARNTRLWWFDYLGAAEFFTVPAEEVSAGNCQDCEVALCKRVAAYTRLLLQQPTCAATACASVNNVRLCLLA